ncbi:putative exosome component 2 [Pavlovales sp. CCMP2436]|nr:putative exosome component 2 [Pavlovales sp. CCMP2436]|mmetsp:Transcript_43965/g.108827  ORF Transcript_43965/g.108827 Transcript_43965/m.108827 type:complete len:305 (-) Transcript_43965:142-1056(-)
MQWVRKPVASGANDAPLTESTWVTPGEELCEEAGFLRGHGTFVKDGMLVAAVAGVVERVNKLVSVRPYKTRYAGEVGDVVVCRIMDVGAKRWKVDVNARQKGILLLSSINLPGGEQRRRTAEDQLNMRQFYVEHDVLSAEVQTFFADGAMSLHTRSLKYGKLCCGTLVTVAPSLVRRAKQHFHAFEFGVAVIFGMNGYVWVGPATEPAAADPKAMDVDGATESAPVDVPLHVRERVCRVRNALVLLDSLYLPVAATTVQSLYELSVEANVSAWEMLLPENSLSLAEKLRTSGQLGAARRVHGDE